MSIDDTRVRLCVHTQTHNAQTQRHARQDKSVGTIEKKNTLGDDDQQMFQYALGGEMYVNLYFFGEGRQIDGLPRVRTR